MEAGRTEKEQALGCWDGRHFVVFMGRRMEGRQVEWAFWDGEVVSQSLLIEGGIPSRMSECSYSFTAILLDCSSPPTGAISSSLMDLTGAPHPSTLVLETVLLSPPVGPPRGTCGYRRRSAVHVTGSLHRP